jgi:Family of unknown function (DUF6328)
MASSEQPDLKEKMDNLLAETRIVLPGTQALLGFQFAGFFSQTFSRLPKGYQYLVFAGLALVALATIFLLAQVARHRLAEAKQASESLYRFGSRLMILAMLALGLALSCDFGIVTFVITRNNTSAITALVVTWVVIYSVWLGYPLYRRRRSKSQIDTTS